MYERRLQKQLAQDMCARAGRQHRFLISTSACCQPWPRLCADDPTCWDNAHAQLLAGSRASATLRGYRLAVERLAVWRDRLFELHARQGGSMPPDCDLQWALSSRALLWARSTVWSRAFNACIDGAKTVVLVPVRLQSAAVKQSLKFDHRVSDADCHVAGSRHA